MYTHDMKTTVQKWGNSLGIRIPKAFAVHLGIESGGTVELAMDSKGLRIKPVKLTIEEMLANMKPEQLHEAIDWGPPVGKEIW